jgi:hypothetical protein
MPLPVSKLSPPPPEPRQPTVPPPLGESQRPAFYPLVLGRTISLAVSQYRFGWTTFGAISLVATIPLVVVNAIVTMATFNAMNAWQETLMAEIAAISESTSGVTPTALATFPWQALGLIFVVGLLIGPISYIGNAALVAAAADVVRGEKLSFVRSYRAAFARIAGLLVLYVIVAVIGIALTMLVAVGPALAILVPGALGGGGPLAFVALVAGVTVLFLSVFVLIRIFFAVEVVIVEGTSVRAALQRSSALVAGSMLRVVGYTLTFGVLLGLIGIVVGVAAYFVSALMSPEYLTSPTPLDVNVVIAQDVATTLVAALFAPISTIGLVLLYFDLRWRHGETVPIPGRAPGS